ncbi:MAG: tetratricopeptide repeat protein [Acidobacteria bacterium]|nr:tetratricopeptide repeat protein [Acidobacteriota bacterium]
MRISKTATSSLLAAALILALPLTAQSGPSASQVSEVYDAATAALEQADYARAVELYSEVVEGGGSRAAAAMYWMAYAQERRGNPAEALELIGELRNSYPESAWIDDADHLAAEIRGARGQVERSDEPEDMRLYALNALLHVEPERALPLLERIIRTDEDIEMRQRALFILLQGHSENAVDLIAEIARDDSDPEMQMYALRHLGMFGGDRVQGLMDEIYAGTTDREVKGAIISGYMMSGHAERLYEIARTEADDELRVLAIRHLAMTGGAEELWQLYDAEESVEARKAILGVMFMTGHSSRLIEIARTEPDIELKRTAIQGLGMVHGEHDEDGGVDDAEVQAALLDLYRANQDQEIRGSILSAFMMRGDATALIDLYDQTEDVDNRRRIVQMLSMVDSDEAVDFLIRIIEQ